MVKKSYISLQPVSERKYLQNGHKIEFFDSIFDNSKSIRKRYNFTSSILFKVIQLGQAKTFIKIYTMKSLILAQDER